jgi:putative ABC transport system substrate-binding protein
LLDRRQLLLAAPALFSAPLLRAQNTRPAPQAPRRIAFLSPSTREFGRPLLDAFRAALKDLGYVEGRDLTIEIRWSEGQTERLPALARELVALKPEVLLTATSLGAAAIKQATSSVPVVFVATGDPVGHGFVASLARPGGNMTGIAYRREFYGKLADLVRESLPEARRIAVLDLESYPSRDRDSAERFFRSVFPTPPFEMRIFRINRAEEIETSFKRIRESKADLVWAMVHGMLVSNAGKIGALALQARLPVVGARRVFAEAGLLSYDNDVREEYRRAAVYVDKILKGAKPADLAVEQLDRFQLVINLRTARALGIKIPQSVLLQATEVIE